MFVKKHKIKIILALILFLALGYSAKNGIFGKNNYEITGNKQNTVIASSEPSAVIKNEEVKKENTDEFGDEAVTPYGQESCQNGTRRSIAVMLAADKETRPLSGLSEADMVFEIPVVTDSITRFMAVYRCSFPKEIGSVRSARHDFIDLALAVDAIYAHWGGSHFALDKLKTGIIDNLDALRNPYNVFYRKKGIAAPHNGFTSGELLLNAAKKLGFRMENKFEGYPREENQIPNTKNQNPIGKLTIGYPGEFKVEYQYDGKTNSYLRWRGGKKEIDRNNKKQVTAKNVIVMYAESKQIEGDYNDVALDGKGKAEFYRNGEKIEGIWKKDAAKKDPKLCFLNNSGAEIKFATGNIWVEIVQTNQSTDWQVE